MLITGAIIFSIEVLLFGLLWWWATYTYNKEFGPKDKKTGEVKSRAQLYIEEQECKERRKYR